MATNIFLKISKPDVKGESNIKDHKEEIELLGWSHSSAQPSSPVRSSAGGGTTERATLMDLSFTKLIDKSSMDFAKFCWSGQHFGEMFISQYRSNGAKDVEFLRIELEDVVISSYGLSTAGGDVPIENISLNYGKITYKYDPTNPETGESTGSKPVTFNLVDGKIA